MAAAIIIPTPRPIRLALILFVLLPFAVSAQSEGLKVSVGIGVLRPSDKHANFYNGSPQNENDMMRIIHSEQYGHEIWNNLTEQGLITDAVSSYSQLSVAEYGNMHYRLSVLLSVGLRYDWPSGWGWLSRIDFSKLNAVGAFNLSATNGTGVLSNASQYVRCGISGEERRINIDLGVSKSLSPKSPSGFAVNAGLNINNSKVEHNDMEIAGKSYDIRDIWNGQAPYYGSTAYEYINQGGLGLGGFAGLEYRWQLTTTMAVTLGATAHYSNIALSGYEGYALHSQFTLKIEIGDFSFLDLEE
ncbi:MAG: hypothetical protein IJU81_04670 [Bacteroidales bacterium]|nr:hypothetical protein [Bacteroidales bacterium]